MFPPQPSTSPDLSNAITRVDEDTTLSQIIKMVLMLPLPKLRSPRSDRVSGIFVPAVITIAIVTTIIWLLTGHEFGYALARGISVLVISCPCALGLATPVAIMVGNGMGARNGILFKTAVSLEEAGKVQIVALDKTGTITSGQPEVILQMESPNRNSSPWHFPWRKKVNIRSRKRFSNMLKNNILQRRRLLISMPFPETDSLQCSNRKL
ncbi:MAG: HAD-IC family P-type ATPase [Blautia obeum]